MLSQLPIDLCFAIVRRAWRRVARAPKLQSAAILGLLVLGTSVNVSLFGLVDGVLFRQLPFFEPERLFRLGSLDVAGTGATALSKSDFDSVAGQEVAIEGITVLSETEPQALQSSTGEHMVGVALGASNMFSVLGVRAALGQAFSQTGDAAEALLTWSSWQQRFGGDPGILGRPVRLNGSSYVVRAVLPREFIFPMVTELPVEVVLPRQLSSGSSQGEIIVGAIVRLRQGRTAEQARHDLAASISRARNEEPRAYERLALKQLSYAPLALPTRLVTWLLAASTVVLIGVAVSLAGLLEFGMWRRRDDIAIATCLGARPWHLGLDVAAETFLFVAVASVLGPIVGTWSAHLTLTYLQTTYLVAWPPGHRAGQTLYAFATPIATGLFAILIAGSRVQRYSRVAMGKARQIGYDARHILMPQVAVAAFATLVASGLVERAAAVGNVDLGYSPDQSIVFSGRMPSGGNPGVRDALRHSLLDRLGTALGTTNVGTVASLPMTSDPPNGQVVVQGVIVNEWGVTGKALSALGARFVEGKDFAASGTTGQALAVLDVSAAKATFPDGPPYLGRQRRDSDGASSTVVGVVEPIRAGYLEPASASAYLLNKWTSYRSSDIFVVAVHAGAAADGRRIDEAAKQLDPRIALSSPIRLSTLLTRGVATVTFPAIVLGIAAGLAVLVSAVGGYASTFYWLASTQKDLALRLALGATGGSIWLLGLWRLSRVLVVGLVAGWALYAVASRLASSISMEFGGGSVGVTLLALVGVYASVLCGAAVSLLRVARLDPAVLLKGD